MVNNPNGVHGRIRLDLNDTTLWNRDEFLEFLVRHQNEVIDIEHGEGVCLETLGVYKLMNMFKFKAVAIRTNNLVESAPAPYKLEIHPAGFRYCTVPPNVDYTPYHYWTGKHVFGALYNRPTWTRVGFTGHLLANYPDKTLMNFRYDPSDPDVRVHFELEKLFEMDPNSVKNYMQINHLLPIRLENEDGYTSGQTTMVHTNQLAKFYPDLLIDVVAETFNRGRSFYPTEKTTRPMLLKKPFILMGSKCFLIHLRQMGFKTFYDFWDEEYDGYNMGERYTKILQLIDSLAKKSQEELQQMYQDMQPILDHNYRLLLEKTFTRNITYVE